MCSVVHMDDFFLRPEQRTSQRLAEPGGNIDYERFMDEVMLPLKTGAAVEYRPYVCSKQAFGEPVKLIRTQYIIIEGSYSLHPKLREHYDWSVFLTTSPEKQRSRILSRSGPERISDFEIMWIPLEEMYISCYHPDTFADVKYKT